jgi:hypothetical protein
MYFYPQSHFLNRFTTLPILLDIILRRCITLLEPTNWEDKNDTYYLEKYKTNKNLKTLLACCFTAKREKFHHWKVFANGPSGICIEFNSTKLLNHVKTIEGTSFKPVSYRYIKYNVNPSLGAWPFLKRQVFEDEAEFRIIYENPLLEQKYKRIPFNLECIDRITLSPWMPRPIANSTVKIIRSIEGCENMKIVHSTLLESSDWKDCIWG